MCFEHFHRNIWILREKDIYLGDYFAGDILFDAPPSISRRARLFPELLGPTRIRASPTSTSRGVSPGRAPALNLILCSLSWVGTRSRSFARVSELVKSKGTLFDGPHGNRYHHSVIFVFEPALG
jgi:hypothetical protein